jgi:hypothetical protein
MTPQPWWQTDTYDHDYAVPWQFEGAELSGPNGPALVKAWPNGKTDPGWGLTSDSGPGFMERYTKGNFRAAPIVFGFNQNRWNFAFVMRSMKVICIDIDGKNGGLKHVGKLGMLPLTLAETSKSGDGYHLFYATSDDEWDPVLGFAEFSDRISIEQGVDIRATGCVYHHRVQRWNGRNIVELPAHLKDRLRKKQQTAAAQTAAIVGVLEGDDQEEVLIMQNTLLEDLKKPIPAGRRNNTLFAIGQQLKLAQVPGWEQALHTRAVQVGLDMDEADKLVANVQKYN